MAIMLKLDAPSNYQRRSQDICNGRARNQNIRGGESGGSRESFPTVKLHYTITKYDTRAHIAHTIDRA